MVQILSAQQIHFPAVAEANEDGLLAIGGDLSEARLVLAYQSGIFPWYSEHEPICWWSPDPRFVLFPKKIYVSKSMKKLFRDKQFTFTINQDFKSVIRNCKESYRKGQPGTWISDEIEKAYINLHHKGYAHSAEAWMDGVLIGGVYGIKVGKVFCGESMFAKESNASKFAFIKLTEQLAKEEFVLIDCQVYTSHLESLGAVHIPRNEFLKYLML